MLNNDSAGLAYTFTDGEKLYCEKLDEAGNMIGQTCSKVTLWPKDKNMIKSAIGIAAINSILYEDIQNFEEGNIMDNLQDLN